MSTDRKVTKSLIATLEDGRKGFEQAADRLADSDQPDLSAMFRTYAGERAAMSSELETMAAAYGDDIDEDGTAVAAAHRGWLAVKDAITGSSASGVLDAAAQGEEHAVSEYRDALGEDISPELRAVLVRQLATVQAAHNDVVARRDATDS